MLLEITKMDPTDYVGFTFFIGYMATAAAVFSSLKETVYDMEMSLLISD